MNKIPKYKTLAEYILDTPPKTKEALLSLMHTIIEVAPNATSKINYNIISFSIPTKNGSHVEVLIAGYKNHVGLYPGVATIQKFSEQLAHLKTGKGSVQFSINEDLPYNLISEMIKYVQDGIFL